MYTVSILGTSKNLELRRFIVTARFTDGDHIVEKDFQFNLTETEEGVKKVLRSALEDFNAVTPTIAEGSIDLAEEVIAEEVKTAEEVAREAWLEQWHIYEKANTGMKSLAEAGIEATAEEVTRFNALKTWVAENRKPEYSQYL
jgi:hypothetical protein